MRSYIWLASMLISVFSLFSTYEAAAQNPEPPDMNKLAEEEADKLQRLLDLEDWQVFYVDSTLKVNYAMLQAEYDKLQTSKVGNIVLYQEAHDRCSDRIDAAYKSFFTEKQWALYLKNGAAKLQKQRAKRKEKSGK